MFLLYNVLITLLSPIWVPLMLLRARKRAEPVNWAERQGSYPFTMRKDRKRIWVHAVSVGEVVAASPILKRLRDRLPDFEIVLSVTTSSGHQTARETVSSFVDHVVYFPIDVPRFTLAAMSRVQPAVVAIMETELWMNFLWAAKVVGAETILVNGRISPNSFRNYRFVGPLTRSIVGKLDQCLMQSASDVTRIEALGAKNARVFGNVKFDEAAEPIAKTAEDWRAELGLREDKPVLVVGSTRSQLEEELVVEAVKKIGLDRVTVVHAPRHLERAEALGERVKEAFGSVAFRSKGEHGEYVILDTYGELSSVYSVASIVVVGGGFDDLGGQNIFQPLAQGKPVIHGPHMTNFAEISKLAEGSGATRIVATASELADQIEKLLADPHKRKAMSDAAFAMIEKNLGAADRYVDAIVEAATRKATELAI